MLTFESFSVGEPVDRSKKLILIENLLIVVNSKWFVSIRELVEHVNLTVFINYSWKRKPLMSV